MSLVAQAVIAAAIAGTVGLTELVSRYRSEPKGAVLSGAGVLYIAVNVAAGFGALYLINALGWTFGSSGTHQTIWRILVAGFGALAFFRSSFFLPKVGGSEVSVGPAAMIEVLLGACDRAVDRKSAKAIAGKLRKGELQGLDAKTVLTTLPALCLALMQNVAASDAALVAAEIAKIQSDEKLSNDAKVRTAVTQLAKFLGPELVLEVVKDSKDTLSAPSPVSAAGTLQAALLRSGSTHQWVSQGGGGMVAKGPEDPSDPPAGNA